MDEQMKPDDKVDAVRSPTETLVDCMEDFGEAEPNKLLVIWTNEAGDLCWAESGRSSFIENIGILDCVRAKLMEKFLQ